MSHGEKQNSFPCPIRWGHIPGNPEPVLILPLIPNTEAARNHLTVARAKEVDPVLVARARKELQKYRGDPAVDEYFANNPKEAL